MNAQSLGDAGTEAVGLDESADQGANVIDAGAVDHVAQSFGPGLAGAHLEVDQVKFIAEVGMGVVQILADAHQGLVQGQAGFDANDGEVERVRQSDADALLTVLDHALEKETRNEETEGGNADQQGHAIDAGENHDAGQTEKREHDAGSVIVADMAGLAKSGLDEPAAGTGYVRRRKWDGLAEGIEGLLEALSYLEGRLFLSHGGLATQGAQAGPQYGSGRDDGRAKGEHHQHDSNEHDDGQEPRHL